MKGLVRSDDARRSVEHGAKAIVVSNHGGRQLDTAPSTCEVLPGVADAVGNSCELYVDGGIRRGSDVLKAIALGARAVLVGRAYAYGLAAAGHAGVKRALQILYADLERTMRLLGCASVHELNSSYLDLPRDWTPLPYSNSLSHARH